MKKRKVWKAIERLKNHRGDIVCVILLLLISLLLVESTGSGYFAALDDYYIDSSVFKYVARVMHNGGMPYLDTFDHKGPVIYLVNYIGLAISQQHGLWLIITPMVAITEMLIYLTCRKVLKKKPFLSLFASTISLTIILSFYDGTLNMPEIYAIPLIAGAGYIFMDFLINDKISTLRLLCCGGLLGLAVLAKPNYAFIWITMAIGVVIKLCREKRTRELLRIIPIFLCGTIISMSPFIIWIVANGAWSDFVYQFILFNALYATDDQWANNGARLNALVFLLKNIFILSPIILLPILYKDKNSNKKIKLALLTCFITLVGAILITAISGQTYNHYGHIFVPLIFIPIILAIDEVIKQKQLIVIILASLYLISTSIFTPWLNAVIRIADNYHYRNNDRDSYRISKIKNIIESNTTEDDPIIVVGNADYIYNRSNRFASSKYSYQIPIAKISDEIYNNFLEDLEYSRPKVIVYMPNNKLDLLQETKDFTSKNNYELVYFEEDETRVYLSSEP